MTSSLLDWLTYSSLILHWCQWCRIILLARLIMSASPVLFSFVDFESESTMGYGEWVDEIPSWPLTRPSRNSHFDCLPRSTSSGSIWYSRKSTPHTYNPFHYPHAKFSWQEVKVMFKPSSEASPVLIITLSVDFLSSQNSDALSYYYVFFGRARRPTHQAVWPTPVFPQWNNQ